MPDYEIFDPVFSSLVLSNAELEVLGTGFRWLEGPVWFADHEILLFSDIPNNRVMRWCEGSITTFQEPSEFANGHARDEKGRLISCLHRGRAITRRELDGRTEILADRFAGRRLNSPNDVTVKRDGSIWFSDPPYGINTDYEGGKQVSESPARVYRLAPDGGTLNVVAEDFDGPNGLCFSPDETRLYICESGKQFEANPKRYIRALDVTPDGKSLGGSRIFHAVTPGFADGIRCDEAGRVWSSAGDGVHCLSPDGKLLGKILTGGTVSNLAFGGRNLSRLFMCAGTRLLAIYTNTRGVG